MDSTGGDNATNPPPTPKPHVEFQTATSISNSAEDARPSTSYLRGSSDYEPGKYSSSSAFINTSQPDSDVESEEPTVVEGSERPKRRPRVNYAELADEEEEEEEEEEKGSGVASESDEEMPDVEEKRKAFRRKISGWGPARLQRKADKIQARLERLQRRQRESLERRKRADTAEFEIEGGVTEDDLAAYTRGDQTHLVELFAKNLEAACATARAEKRKAAEVEAGASSSNQFTVQKDVPRGDMA